MPTSLPRGLQGLRSFWCPHKVTACLAWILYIPPVITAPLNSFWNQYIFTVVCTYVWGPCRLVGALNTSLGSILSRTSFIFSSYPSPNSMRHCSSIENVACSVDLRWVAFPVFGWFLRHGHCLSTSQKLAWNRNKVDKMCINHEMALVDRNGANMSCSDTSVSIRRRVCSRDISCIFLLLILYI